MDVENNEDRRLIFIIMKNILTPEEKKYLNRTCNYLASLGMEEGTIGIELDDHYYLDDNTVDWNYVSYFENNYRAELPDGLKPILKKIFDFIVEEDLFESPDVDDVNYSRIDIEIKCPTKEVSVIHWFSYYDRGDSQGITYDSDEDKERFEKWMDEDLSEIEVPKDGILTLDYNGSGDSGYIESSFNQTGDAVPASIEDWCYQQLESHFGGWEINEGSDGRFIFNFNDSTVELEHTYNTEENSSNTLYEESFAL